MPRDEWEGRAVGFLLTAAFPRLAYWARWPTRLGPRGLVAWVAYNTFQLFAMRTWALPWLRRVAEEQERSGLRRQQQAPPAP